MTPTKHLVSIRHENKQARASGDDGSVLVMALVFVSVIGLIISALLVQSQANLRTTSVVEAKTDKTYAADAGIQYGLEMLKQGAPYCASTEAGTETLPQMTIDGITVNVTCQTTTGSLGRGQEWAVVTTDNSVESLTTHNAEGRVKKIQGPVWTGGMEDGINLEVIDGDVREQASVTTCTTAADKPSTLSVAVPYTYTCEAGSPVVVMPTLPTLSELTLKMPAHSDGKPAKTIGDCAIFTPGVYTATPLLDNNNYFVSGIYYFKNIGDWEIKNQNLIGGAKASDETATLGLTGCSTDAAAASYMKSENPATGTGVKFLLGGSSAIDVANGTGVELYRRNGGDSWEGTQGVTIQSVPVGEAGWVGSTLTLEDVILQVAGGDKAQFAVHGSLYLPKARVLLAATNDSDAQILGGVVAGRLDMQASASASGLVVSIATAPVVRQTILTATATGASGEKSMVAEAVVTFDSRTHTYNIESWRTE